MLHYTRYTFLWVGTYWHFQSVWIEGPSNIQMKGEILNLKAGDWKQTHPQIISIKNIGRELLQGETILIHFKGIPPVNCCEDDKFFFEFRKNHDLFFSSEIGDIFLCGSNRKKMSKQMLETIKYIPNNPYQLKITAMPTPDKIWKIYLDVQDGFGNYITDYTGKCYLSIPFYGSENRISLKVDSSRIQKIKAIHYDNKDPLYVSAKSNDKRIKSIQTHAIGNFDEEWNVYFGDIHGHSTYSDGRKSLEDYYDFAQNKAHLSVCALVLR